jgi:DNA-binding NarL/FixJ family response regulator
MLRTALLYGAALAALTGLLKYFEYRYFVRDLSLEFYLGAVALVCAGLGVWAGLRLTRRTPPVIPPDFRPDPDALARLGISPREREVLELIAQGLSNQEIAARLFVSPHTVKTHSSSLFAKLDARRRTQAVSRAKELGLLP